MAKRKARYVDEVSIEKQKVSKERLEATGDVRDGKMERRKALPNGGQQGTAQQQHRVGNVGVGGPRQGDAMRCADPSVVRYCWDCRDAITKRWSSGWSSYG